MTSIVVWCDFNEKSGLHFGLCRFLLPFLRCSCLFFELLDVCSCMCALVCALVNVCRLCFIQDPVTALSCGSAVSLLGVSRSDLNLAAAIRVLLSRSGFARPWIHCSALPSCCWRISLYCSYFSHRQDVRDEMRKIRFFSCSQTVRTDDVSWCCSDSGFHCSPWRSAPAATVLS
jgi:hypothetical protein